MRVVNEGALYSDQSKLSVAFYLRARSIRGRGVFEEIRYVGFMIILSTFMKDPKTVISVV